MPSIANELRKDLEKLGEYVVRANGSTGWFAVFPPKWKQFNALAQQYGRKGPNLIICKTNTDNNRNHWVVPYTVTANLLVEDSLTHSDVNGISRWNLTLKNGKLHVSHKIGDVDIDPYYGAQLLVEEKVNNFPHSFFPDEIPETSEYYEGSVKKIFVNRYERDPRARKECIDHYGVDCFICGFSFSAVYGDIADDFIHVHHLKPLSEIGADYKVNPIDDLRPLCPNCHAVVHRRTPPYSPEELRLLLRPTPKVE